MLTKLAVNPETRLYAYFSDPFVRRLVSPRVKIGQRRRVLAKAKMEALTARAMLAQLNGQEHSTATNLISRQYLPPGWKQEDFTVSNAGVVRSERYDTLPDMRSLPEVPLEKITPAEAEAIQGIR